MHHHGSSSRLDEASQAQIAWADGSPDILALERNASEGCSVCARALVNAREIAVEIALSEAVARPVPSRERSQRALLDRTRATMSKRKARASERDPSGPKSEDAARRILDASATVAQKHIGLPGEEARIREIDALRAAEPRPGEGTERLLSQLSRFIDFTIFFVSIVRGERVSYRAQHGLPESMRAFRELRREMSYCTHCVSGNLPLLVENALIEPFFRGNKAATRFGIAAYAGVPLRSAAGLTLGTLCALDFTPRAIPEGTVGVLELFARRAAAEIEHERTPGILGEIVEQGSPRGDVHCPSFFADLVSAELKRRGAGGGSALLAVRSADPRAVFGWIDEHETVGRIDGSTFGILLPCVGEGAAAERFARLRADAGASAVGWALPKSATSTAQDWIALALH